MIKEAISGFQAATDLKSGYIESIEQLPATPTEYQAAVATEKGLHIVSISRNNKELKVKKTYLSGKRISHIAVAGNLILAFDYNGK